MRAAPKALLEAAVCALPIVTTDTQGCREIVRDGDNGLLISPRGAQALADAIERLIRIAELRARIRARGRRRVVEGFSEEQIVSETLRLYQEVVLAIGLPAA